MSSPRTIIEKVWDAHVVAENPGAPTLPMRQYGSFNPGQGLGVNDVTSFATTANNNPAYLNFLVPGSSIFNNPKAVFASNARSIALVAKFTF